MDTKLFLASLEWSCLWHLQFELSSMASLAFEVRDGIITNERQLFSSWGRTGVFASNDFVYLLRDDGAVVLKDEPLNVMGPKTLLFNRLGLEHRQQQALVIETAIYITQTTDAAWLICI